MRPRSLAQDCLRFDRRPMRCARICTGGQIVLRGDPTAGPHWMSEPVPRVGDLTVDLPTARAFVARRGIELTTSETRIPALLTSADGDVSRQALVEHLWGSYHSGGERAVEVHVSNLRRKLDPDKGHPPRIATVLRWRLPPARTSTRAAARIPRPVATAKI